MYVQLPFRNDYNIIVHLRFTLTQASSGLVTTPTKEMTVLNANYSYILRYKLPRGVFTV